MSRQILGAASSRDALADVDLVRHVAAIERVALHVADADGAGHPRAVRQPLQTSQTGYWVWIFSRLLPRMMHELQGGKEENAS